MNTNRKFVRFRSSEKGSRRVAEAADSTKTGVVREDTNHGDRKRGLLSKSRPWSEEGGGGVRQLALNYGFLNRIYPFKELAMSNQMK